MAIDTNWRDAVRGACDPVFAAADVGFEWNNAVAFDDDPPAMLWEANPERFAARYPDSEIEESYGEQWPQVTCIDYWVYVDPEGMTVRLSVEGWDGPDVTLRVTGDGKKDGERLAATFAEKLGVPCPRQS